MQISLRPRQLVAFLVVLLVCVAAQSPSFAARTQEANLIRYSTETVADRPAGVRGNMLLATDGNIYFVSTIGGTPGRGGIGRLAPDGTLSVLYAFPSENNAPVRAVGGLIQANDGHLYGTSFIGGEEGAGTIFRVTLAGEFTLLRSMGVSATDASLPYTGLVQAPDNMLYGTTLYGGNNNKGTIFRIGLDGNNFSIVHHFNESDGENPEGALVVGHDGELYGTTMMGGASDRGTVYRFTTAGVHTLLYSFPSLSAFGNLGTAVNATGANPRAGLLFAADGNYYGTTYQGGPDGAGTVFRMTPDGTVSVFHSFAGPSRDGGFPLSSVAQDGAGNFYGTTQAGGALDVGTAWRISAGGEFSLLHHFVDSANDGSNPNATLLPANGRVFAASFTGPSNTGSIVELDLGSGGTLPIEISVSPADIIAGESATLTWSSPTAEAATCKATGTWTNGDKAASGTETVTLLTPGRYIYALSCTDGAGVLRNAYAALVVDAPNRQPVDGGGGTGSLSLMLLLLLVVLLSAKRPREIFKACP